MPCSVVHSYILSQHSYIHSSLVYRITHNNGCISHAVISKIFLVALALTGKSVNVLALAGSVDYAGATNGL